MEHRLDLMTSLSGCPITSVQDWERYRRPELMALLEYFQFGIRPSEKPEKLSFRINRKAENWLGTEVDFTAVEIRVNDVPFPVYLYTPHGAQKPVPCFAFVQHERCMKEQNLELTLDHNILPIPRIIQRGYAIAVMPVYYVSPDWTHHSGFQKGVFQAMQPNVSKRTSRSWATISGWAFGISRVLDYLQTDPRIDSTNVAVIGHSRAGKTALWAGATDHRFKLVISNSSGCGGAAYTRGKKGEHLKDINVSDWFCDNYHQYDDREEMLPFDQHMLLATIAPRALYIKSDQLDEWADPDAEVKSARLASSVYELYGLKGLVAEDQIQIMKPYHEGRIAYHRAAGDHHMDRKDWELYMDFADIHLK